jgi:hypothetical protein
MPLPRPKATLKQYRILYSGILDHPGYSGGLHSETGLVHDCSFVSRHAQTSKFVFEVFVKNVQILAVGARDEVMKEVSVSCSGNMSSRIGAPRTGIKDNEVLGG